MPHKAARVVSLLASESHTLLALVQVRASILNVVNHPKLLTVLQLRFFLIHRQLLLESGNFEALAESRALERPSLLAIVLGCKRYELTVEAVRGATNK